MYLTDTQYKRILDKIRGTVESPTFKPSCFDSTAEGDKYTESNCGFCNDNFTEIDTALFPDQFPKRKSMKYRAKNHKCPFDMRKEPGLLGWGSGCFYKCYLFKSKDQKVEALRAFVKGFYDQQEN